MRARDVMTADVVTVTEDADVRDVARLLLRHRISAVPIVDSGNRVLGIVSEGDLMQRPEAETEYRLSWWLAFLAEPRDRAKEYVKHHSTRVKDVMTRDVVAVTEDTTLNEIAHLLETRRIKRVPVLRGGVLVGIVSRANLLQGLASSEKRPLAAPAAEDRAIRERVVADLEADLGITSEIINVIVSEGTVELWGMVDSADEKQAILLAARNAPGVKDIRDHVYVPTRQVRSLDWGV